MRSLKPFGFAIVLATVSLVVAACGSNSSTSSTSSSAGAGTVGTSGFQSPLTEPETGGKRGGTLVILNEQDFEHLDPGDSYYDIDYEVVYATQRPLYSVKPDSAYEAVPDLAEGQPEISSDQKTITVHIKHGIHFSPPVDREVTSEDVAYAMERGANPNIENPYFHTYFESIEGAPKADGGPIMGIQTPNKYTIVFHLTEPKAAIVVDAMRLPLTAPVPKEYAEKFDKNKPSDYANYEVATGPYMLKNNAQGKVLGIGYVPGKSATLVRNPNWSSATDYRPAYLNEIQYKIGGTESVIGRQVLESADDVQNEPPVPSDVQLAAESHKSQLEISPGAGDHYIAVDNKVGPFSNIDLRKAFWAALDRKAMDKALGGELVTNVMTHFLYPTVPGFEQAGGLAGPKGPQFDFDEHPEGDMAVAEKYMKLAGYPTGKYTGTKTVQIVGATGNREPAAEIANQTLKNLGFPTKLTLVETATMYSKYCNVPKEEIEVCPTVGWAADFGDGQAVLDATFNGRLINPTNNENWSQTDVPKINAAMDAAESIVGIAARASAWAKIDDELVEDAAAIPYDYEKEASLEGSQVAGVGDLWNSGLWNLSFTSLK